MRVRSSSRFNRVISDAWSAGDGSGETIDVGALDRPVPSRTSARQFRKARLWLAEWCDAQPPVSPAEIAERQGIDPGDVSRMLQLAFLAPKLVESILDGTQPANLTATRLKRIGDLPLLMKRYGLPKVIVTDKLRSYGAAMKVIGNADRQETGRWLNNRAENSHQPFRRRERAMLRFRRMRSLQKFAAVHSSIYNHFNQERHLYGRDNFKLNRAAALAEWRQLGAA